MNKFQNSLQLWGPGGEAGLRYFNDKINSKKCSDTRHGDDLSAIYLFQVRSGPLKGLIYSLCWTCHLDYAKKDNDFANSVMLDQLI